MFYQVVSWCMELIKNLDCTAVSNTYMYFARRTVHSQGWFDRSYYYLLQGYKHSLPLDSQSETGFILIFTIHLVQKSYIVLVCV